MVQSLAASAVGSPGVPFGARRSAASRPAGIPCGAAPGAEPGFRTSSKRLFAARQRTGAPSSPRGFTLLELLATIAITAIVLAMAVPSFENLILRNRLSAASQSLTRGAQLARSEAVKRSMEVRLIPASGGWGEGWAVVADTDRDGSYTDEQPLFVGEPLHDSLVVNTAGGHSLANGHVAFSALGSMTPHTDRFALTVKDTGCDYHEMVNLSLSVAGEILSDYTACT